MAATQLTPREKHELRQAEARHTAVCVARWEALTATTLSAAHEYGREAYMRLVRRELNTRLEALEHLWTITAPQEIPLTEPARQKNLCKLLATGRWLRPQFAENRARHEQRVADYPAIMRNTVAQLTRQSVRTYNELRLLAARYNAPLAEWDCTSASCAGRAVLMTEAETVAAATAPVECGWCFYPTDSPFRRPALTFNVPFPEPEPVPFTELFSFSQHTEVELDDGSGLENLLCGDYTESDQDDEPPPYSLEWGDETELSWDEWRAVQCTETAMDCWDEDIAYLETAAFAQVFRKNQRRLASRKKSAPLRVR